MFAKNVARQENKSITSGCNGYILHIKYVSPNY